LPVLPSSASFGLRPYVGDSLSGLGGSNPVKFTMPGTSGPEVAHAARRNHSNVPIVIMTGYADARTLVEPLPPRVVLLKKPFKIHQLAAALESASIEALPTAQTDNVVSLPSRR
jgi:FixJ family two-component response regulator